MDHVNCGRLDVAVRHSCGGLKHWRLEILADRYAKNLEENGLSVRGGLAFAADTFIKRFP